MLDPKFGEKFEVVFEEHINGWAGKSFKKQKTESDLNMEWRLRLKDKQEKDKQVCVLYAPFPPLHPGVDPSPD